MVKIKVTSKCEKNNGMSIGVLCTHAYRGTPRKSGVRDHADYNRFPAN